MGGLSPRAKYLLYRSLGEAMGRVPEPVARACAGVVGEVMSHQQGANKQMAIRHLRRVLGSASTLGPPDEAMVRRLARKSFRSYGRYWFEAARLPAMDPAEVRRRMRVDAGYQYLQAAMAAGNGVVLALPHVGSWEWGGAFLASDGFPMTSVAERIEPPELFDWFIAQREAMGLKIIPLDQASSAPVLRRLREGGLIGLLCDRDIAGNGIEVDFFGERTTLPAGPATLALRSGAALLSAVVYSGPGPFHTAQVSPPYDMTRSGSLRKDVARLTQELAHAFEGYIRQAPEQWHLFQPNWPSDDEFIAHARSARSARR
jgi:phosphatidylinositol dimannoside acyltransferase